MSIYIFVTTVSMTSPWWQNALLFGHFYHRGVPYQPMVTKCTTFWSFLSPRCPLAAHGDKMHHFLVIFVTAVSLTSPWWQHEPLFGHFCHRRVLDQPMVTTCTTIWSFWSPRCYLHAHGGKLHHFLVIFVTAESLTSPWWQHAPLFGHFCHRCVLDQPMVTTCTTFWSFLSPRCPWPAHGDNIYHFLVIFVTALSSCSPWWQNAPLFGHFCHRGVLDQPMVTTYTTFWSFLLPWYPLPAHGDNMHDVLVNFDTAAFFTSPWWQHKPLFGHFCHRGVFYQHMATKCTTFWSFLSPRCPLPANGDNIYHFLVIFVIAVSFTSPWWQNAPLCGHFCDRGVPYQPMVTKCTTFRSCLSPRCPLLAHGDNMHHHLVIFVTAVSFTSPWWQNAPLFGHFCHRSVI